MTVNDTLRDSYLGLMDDVSEGYCSPYGASTKAELEKEIYRIEDTIDSIDAVCDVKRDYYHALKAVNGNIFSADQSYRDAHETYQKHLGLENSHLAALSQLSSITGGDSDLLTHQRLDAVYTALLSSGEVAELTTALVAKWSESDLPRESALTRQLSELESGTRSSLKLETLHDDSVSMASLNKVLEFIVLEKSVGGWVVQQYDEHFSARDFNDDDMPEQYLVVRSETLNDAVRVMVDKAVRLISYGETLYSDGEYLNEDIHQKALELEHSAIALAASEKLANDEHEVIAEARALSLVDQKADQAFDAFFGSDGYEGSDSTALAVSDKNNNQSNIASMGGPKQ